MNPTGYDDLGPRIDMDEMDQAPKEDLGPSRQINSNPSPMPTPRPAKSGGSTMGLIGLVLGIIALAVASFALFSSPEPQAVPVPSMGAVPGAEAERIAKLEKDVNALMLQFVTLEKEIKALGHKAGSVAKLTELNAQVQAMIGRIEAVENQELDRKMAALGSGGKKQPEAKPKAEEPKAKSSSGSKKVTYKVRSGDTLYTVARKHKVSVKQLAKWNKISSKSKLFIGQKLVIYR